MFRNMQHCSLQPEPYVMIAIHFCHNIFARMLSNDYVGSFFTSKGFLDLLLLIPLLLSVSFYTVPFLFFYRIYFTALFLVPLNIIFIFLCYHYSLVPIYHVHTHMYPNVQENTIIIELL